MRNREVNQSLSPTIVYPNDINTAIVAQKTSHQGSLVVSHHFEPDNQIEVAATNHHWLCYLLSDCNLHQITRIGDREYIGEMRRANDISLSELASQVKLSQSHFSHLFRQSTGKSPYKFLIQQRVNRAKELLLERDIAIADIAISVGFYDQSHLSRHTKKLLGVSPRQLRQQR